MVFSDSRKYLISMIERTHNKKIKHAKKIIPMTHSPMWRDMTPAQRAAYIRRTTLTTTAEKIKALKEARKQKSADENTPLGETKLTPEEQEAALLALEAEKEQGTGFDYVREKTHPTPAISAAKKIAEKLGKKIAEEAAKKIAKKLADKKAADEKKRADDKKKAKEALDKLVHDIFNPFYRLGRTEKKTKI